MPTPVVPMLLLLALAPSTRAGESLSLHDKLARSALVLEVRLPVSGAIPSEWPNQHYDPQGWGFPDSLVVAGRAQATVTRVVVGAGGIGALPQPQDFHVFGSASACWWLAHQRGGLRTLVFLERDGDGWKQVLGTEQEWGGYTDLEPRYDQLVEALSTASGWTDERAQGVAPESLWQDQRQALVGDDPYLLLLAREFLLIHEASGVLDQVWGVPGSPERAVWEAKAAWPRNPGRCLARLEGR